MPFQAAAQPLRERILTQLRGESGHAHAVLLPHQADQVQPEHQPGVRGAGDPGRHRAGVVHRVPDDQVGAPVPGKRHHVVDDLVGDGVLIHERGPGGQHPVDVVVGEALRAGLGDVQNVQPRVILDLVHLVAVVGIHSGVQIEYLTDRHRGQAGIHDVVQHVRLGSDAYLVSLGAQGPGERNLDVDVRGGREGCEEHSHGVTVRGGARRPAEKTWSRSPGGTGDRHDQAERSDRSADPIRGNGSVAKTTSTGTSKYAAMRSAR